MILKGSQCSHGQNLATYLMKERGNEHVTLHDLRGFVASDLNGAFREAEAISRGTRCEQYLFSLSLSPPEYANAPDKLFDSAIARIEERLGLTGQPRAVVFHEKEGRRHAHCVWSRIDAQTMTARQLSHFKYKLRDVSRELYLEHGWTMPKGLTNSAERNPNNFTLAEWQQAKRQGMDPRWLRQTLQSCWKGADNAKSLAHSLEEKGFFLARGDKRGLVILDYNGEIWSLPRQLGIHTKFVRDRIGSAKLPSVADTQALIAQRMTPRLRSHIAESRVKFKERTATLDHYKMQMKHLHSDARTKLRERLDKEWLAETKVRAARLPRGIRGLWWRITGKYQEVRRENSIEAAQSHARKREEFQALKDGQIEQRRVLQDQYKDLRARQAEQLLTLRTEIGRYLKMSHGHDARQTQSHQHDAGRGLDLSL